MVSTSALVALIILTLSLSVRPREANSLEQSVSERTIGFLHI